jgi:hypothetical protein
MITLDQTIITEVFITSELPPNKISPFRQEHQSQLPNIQFLLVLPQDQVHHQKPQQNTKHLSQ